MYADDTVIDTSGTKLSQVESVLQAVLGSPVIKPEGNEHIIKRGQTITLTCSGNHTVKWVVPFVARRATVKNEGTSSVLIITKATEKYNAPYKCLYNDTRYTGSASVHIFVKGAKYWNILQHRIAVDEDTNATLPCLITDPSIPLSMISLDYKSNANNQQISYTFNPHGGYTIYNVQVEFSGYYICKAKVNGEWNESEEITLSVQKVEKVPPSVFLDSSNHIRIKGEPFRITCNVTHSLIPEAEWKYPGKNAFIRAHLNYRDSLWTAISILNIPAVEISDSGTYECIGKNKAGSNKIPTFLQVIDKGYVQLSTSQNMSSTVKTGENVELMIEVDAYPTDLSWKWIHKHDDNTTEVTFLGNVQSTGTYRWTSILTLNRLQKNESGTYTFYVENSNASNSVTFEINLFSRPSVDITTISFNGTRSLNCRALGNPLPSVEWYMCTDESCKLNGKQIIPSDGTKVEDNAVESTLHLHENQINSSIACMASNIEGTDTKITLFTTSTKTFKQLVENKLFTPLLTITSLLGSFLLIVSVFLYYKYQQKPKYEVRWQIVQASEGNNYICIDPTQLPYNERWEFPRNNLQFGKTLGAGAFGKVMEATAFGMGKDDSALRVAVKMLKPSAHTDEVEALMSELKILSHLGHHQNIVNLLGACTHGGPILVITEYCQHGDLSNFLRRKAEVMNSMFAAVNTNGDYKNISVEQKCMTSDDGLLSQGTSNYLEMKPVPSNVSSTQGNPDAEEEDTDDHLPLDLYDLLNFSLHVAQGMSFLAAKNCIHRDVAARNVLVTNGRMAKICDFGLARDIENDSNYVVKGNARLPVKWMAPESIFDCIYTVQSDVWSYGILLWEIFSLGRSPYPGILVNRKFYKMVKDGYKMDCPDYAPLEIYRLMKACWDLEPTQRPTFNQISNIINKQMSIIKEQDYTNIAQIHEEDECADTKCEEDEPFVKGNNYQFC
ncbi:macrophage colony-stimulating factor 1 receptor [Pelodytes ibericus]